MTTTTSLRGEGLCRLCYRDLYQHGYYNSPLCDACLTLTRRSPGRDVTTIRNGRTELVPQERPIRDWTWRDYANCIGAPIELFCRTLAGTARFPAEIGQAATVFCRGCPVFDQCRAEADEHKYEGLWAGAWRRLKSDGSHKASVYTVRDLLGDDNSPEQVA